MRTMRFCLLIIIVIMFTLALSIIGADREVVSKYGKEVTTGGPQPATVLKAGPEYSDDAGSGYGYCYSGNPLFALQGGDTTITLTMFNAGDAPNAFTIAVTYENGSGWVLATPSSGEIPAGGQYSVNLTFSAPPGAPAPSLWKCTIIVTHQAANSPRSIPACLDIPVVDPWPSTAILATTCKRLWIGGNGKLANNLNDAALDYIDDCDTFNSQTKSHIYLYDGSPIVTWIKGVSDTVRYCASYESLGSSSGMRALANLAVDSTTNPSYTYAVSRFCTADSSIGFVAEYFAPKSPDSCDFVICKLKFVNQTPATLVNVQVGEFLDWDVPSDSGVRNGSGFDAVNRFIYQVGAEFNADDSTEALCPQKSDQRFAAIASIENLYSFGNYMTIDNATYIYETGPYHATLAAGAIYRLMHSSGYQLYSTTHPESTYVDLSTLVTFGRYNLVPNDTSRVGIVLATTKTGLSNLTTSISKGRQFAYNHKEIRISCCRKPGDVNFDAKIGVGDAVYLINMIFKGGPLPPCKAQADTNGDCRINVGDVVYLINYTFKGGPAPHCPPESCDY